MKEDEKNNFRMRILFRYPITSFLMISFLYVGILLLNNLPTMILVQIFKIPLDSWFVYVVYELLLFLYVIVFLFIIRTGIGDRKQVTGDKQFLWSGFLLLAESIYIFLVNIKRVIENGDRFIGWSQLLSFVFYLILVAATEELLFRVCFQLLLKKYENHKGFWLYGAILNGIFFGIMHIVNVVNLGVGLRGVVFQCISAGFIGMYYDSIYRLTNRVWYVILLHFIYNFSQMAANVLFIHMSLDQVFQQYNGQIDVAYFIFHHGVYLVVTVWILYYARKKKVG